MLGALVPYVVFRVFSTRAMASKWCSFQKLSEWGEWYGLTIFSHMGS